MDVCAPYFLFKKEHSMLKYSHTEFFLHKHMLTVAVLLLGRRRGTSCIEDKKKQIKLQLVKASINEINQWKNFEHLEPESDLQSKHCKVLVFIMNVDDCHWDQHTQDYFYEII